MPDLGAELAARIQSGVITAMYVQDWRVRAKAAAAQRTADLLGRQQTAARVGHLTQAGLDTATEKATAARAGDSGQAPRPRDYLQLWAEAADGRYGRHSVTVQGHCEAVLRDLTPELMARYDAARAAGQEAVVAMRGAAQALVTTGRATPADPGAQTAAARGSDVTGAAAAPRSTGDGRAWPAAFTCHPAPGAQPAPVTDLAQHRAARRSAQHPDGAVRH
jgi:hypothetical protein